MITWSSTSVAECNYFASEAEITHETLNYAGLSPIEAMGIEYIKYRSLSQSLTSRIVAWILSTIGGPKVPRTRKCRFVRGNFQFKVVEAKLYLAIRDLG